MQLLALVYSRVILSRSLSFSLSLTLSESVCYWNCEKKNWKSAVCAFCCCCSVRI